MLSSDSLKFEGTGNETLLLRGILLQAVSHIEGGIYDLQRNPANSKEEAETKDEEIKKLQEVIKDLTVASKSLETLYSTLKNHSKFVDDFLYIATTGDYRL